MSEFLNELKEKRNYIDTQLNDIAHSITNMCINSIKLINTNGVTNFIYEVPPFLIGYPLYNIKHVSYSVNKKLKKLGLNTVFFKPNKIYISWEKI